MRGRTREGTGGKCTAEQLGPQVGGSHRIAKCNAKGYERLTVRNYISRQNTIVQEKCTMGFWARAGSEAAGGRSAAGSVNRTEHRSSGSLRPSSVHYEPFRAWDRSRTLAKY